MQGWNDYSVRKIHSGTSHFLAYSFIIPVMLPPSLAQDAFQPAERAKGKRRRTHLTFKNTIQKTYTSFAFICHLHNLVIGTYLAAKVDGALFWPVLYLAKIPIIMEEGEDIYWEVTSRLCYRWELCNHLK